MKYKRLKFSIGLLLIVCLQTYAQEHLHNTTSSDQQHINEFKEKAPLCLVDIGDTKLATRHYKGTGIPLVLIHGTLEDHHSLITLAALLAKKTPNPIVLYDLRGHSVSVLTNNTPGSIVQDANDVAKLIKKLGYDSAHIVGHSYGANITIKLANTHPHLVANLFLYEPPTFGLLANKPQYKKGVGKAMQTIAQTKTALESGAIERGVKLFIENIAFGVGSWNKLLDKRTRSVMTLNYLTFLDQLKDQQRFYINIAKLNQLQGKIILFQGAQSLPLFKASIQEIKPILNNEQVLLIEGAGHEGIFTQADQVAAKITKSLK
ncbi:hypothetical protein BKI52_38305 [marine bacterium AO1-C]|nr:hypothetical protein BKI52_38305 [marine bacterium AO1-C]